MNNREELKKRILRGIEHFRDIEPSAWNVVHITHAKVLHRLMESYINGENVHFTDLKSDKRENVVEAVKEKMEDIKEVFGI